MRALGVVLAVVLTVVLAHPSPASAQGAVSESDRDAGDRLFDARRYDDAQRRLEGAMKSDPRDARSAMLLGGIALVRGDGTAGVKWLERAVGLAPNDAQARWWLGRAYARQLARAGRLAQIRIAGRMREALERAVALDPSLVEARLDLMRFYLVAPGVVGGGTDKAKAQAREIEKLSAWRGRLAAGAVAEKERDGARAEREYRAAVVAAPDSAEGYIALGAMFERSENWDRAFALYDTLHSRTRATVAHYQVGRAASLSGRELDRGARALEQYVNGTLEPGDPSLASAWYRLGLVYEKLGDRARARQAFERVLVLDSRQSEAKDALARVR
jgi:tetratricopeptide (TPR) repeat protein